MHVDRSGSGPDVVVLHGMPQPPRDMERFAGPLRDGYTVTIVHLPGYGESPAATNPYDVAAVDAQVVHALQGAGVHAPVLIGMSLGSYRAFQIALDHPELEVRATAHLAPLANLTAEERQGMLAFAEALRSGADLLDVVVQRMFSPAYADGHVDQCREVARAMLDAVPVEAAAAELEGIAAMTDLRPRLPALRSPTYLRVGELDVASPARHAREIAEALPNAELDVVPGAGHLLHYEDVEHTVAALRSFVDRVT